MYRIKLIFLLLILPCFLFSRQIETFYGPIEVQEEVILELIDSPMFQRLKSVRQYGVSYYITHKEPFYRFDHSVGVFALLRMKGSSLEEQIAGLLHDVSHTAFSHVGDWVFGKENQEADYQDTIHQNYLEKSGLEDILKKYHLTAEQILPRNELFPALENSAPEMCADRIDYNIQGAYYQGFISYEEALEIYNDIQFVEGRWVSFKPDLMKKLVRFSLHMTQTCWGSPENYLTSKWLADAILKVIELGDLSYSELHFGTDQVIWDKLIQHEDPFIQLRMHMILNYKDYYAVVDPKDADMIIKNKFRGINPWILCGSICQRLNSLDADLSQEYENVKQIMKNGWPVKLGAVE